MLSQFVVEPTDFFRLGLFAIDKTARLEEVGEILIPGKWWGDTCVNQI